MKRICLILLFFTISCSAIGQRRMITHKKDGTREYAVLSLVDSVTFSLDTLMTAAAAGSFTAGTTLTTVSSFCIDKYEVTYELWTAVRTWASPRGYSDLPAGQSGGTGSGGAASGTNNPVTQVSWYDVVKWCNARSEKDGLTPVYYTGSAKTIVYRTGEAAINTNAVNWTANGYRLPTEAEWEFAAKGGALATPYTYSGSNTIDNVAWYTSNSGSTTHAIGTKTGNELGIYDMTGNVFEWCWDWHSSSFPSGGTADPKGPDAAQTERVLRGGAFGISADYCGVAVRTYNVPTARYYGFGFRCVQR